MSPVIPLCISLIRGCLPRSIRNGKQMEQVQSRGFHHSRGRWQDYFFSLLSSIFHETWSSLINKVIFSFWFEKLFCDSFCNFLIPLLPNLLFPCLLPSLDHPGPSASREMTLHIPICSLILSKAKFCHWDYRRNTAPRKTKAHFS